MEVAFAERNADNAVVVERDGKREKLSIRPTYDEEHGLLAIGVGRVASIELPAHEEGGKPFRIGALESVTVEGVPALGGEEAFARIQQALDAGRYPVTVTRADGTTFTLRASKPDADETGKEPGAKVGLAPYLVGKVKSLRSGAARVLAKADVIRAAVRGEARVPIQSLRQWAALPFGGEVDGFVVERAGSAKVVSVHLATPAAIAAFQNGVAFEDHIDLRVVPLPPGAIYVGNGRLWRYPGAPALEAGIRPGDKITRVGETVIHTFGDIPKALKAAEAGKPVDLRVENESGVERSVSLTPVALELIGPLPITTVEYKEHWHADGLGGALGMGFDRTVRETKGVFRTIGALFTGNINFNKNIAGPITLIRASKRFAEDSLLKLVWFLAYVSVMLAVLNILPIPVLDGGHLMFILFEKIKGRPLDDKTIYNLQKVGFLLLLVLMFFAFKNDITRAFQ
jgi:regulator of sigma E protease